MTTPKGYIRERAGKLEAVIKAEGKKIRRSTGLDVGQEGEAEAVLAEALRQLQADSAPATGALTVKAWGERWIADRKARNKLEWIIERGHLEHYLYPAMGTRQVAQVSDVDMLDWARDLVKVRGPSGKNPGPKYIRKITATARALFKEAVRRHLVERTPCIWEDSDLPELEANSRVIGAGFEPDQVALLIYDERIARERRVRYALEFLTGMRPGEVAALSWADWETSYRGGLGRIIARRAYSTRHRIVKETKTRVEKWIPVHPALAELLDAWKREGWEAQFGRPPTEKDWIVPAEGGGLLNNSFTWRLFTLDLKRIGLDHQRHYETRSTFINLAEGAGAEPHYISRITHPSVRDAKDLYQRAPQLWPRLCEAVMKIRIPRPEASQPVRVTEGVTAEVPGSPESARSASDSEGFPKTGNGGRAWESNPPGAPLSTPHRF